MCIRTAFVRDHVHWLIKRSSIQHYKAAYRWVQTYIEQRRYRERGNWDRSFYFSFRPTEPIRHGHVDPLSLFVAYTQLELDKHIPPRLHYSMGILSGPNSTQVTNSFLFLSSSSFYFLIVCRNDLHFHSGPLFFLSFSPGGLLENSRLACCLLNIRATVERKRRLGGFFFFKEKTNMDQTSVSFFFLFRRDQRKRWIYTSKR